MDAAMIASNLNWPIVLDEATGSEASYSHVIENSSARVPLHKIVYTYERNT